MGTMDSKSVVEKKEQKSQYLDIRDICSINGSAKFDPNTNITTLTEAINSQAGAIAGKTAFDMRHDFTLVADIYLGSKGSGADGIAIAFHRGSIGFIGSMGGGLGILGAPNGIGFEIDTYWKASSDETGDSFGHGQMNGTHAGFVSTNRNTSYLTALAPMQRIPAPNSKWRILTINWDARNNKLTARLQEKNNDDTTRSASPRYQTWELLNPAFDLNQKYTFVIGSATGAANNKHQIGVTLFEAYFTKPTIEANPVDIEIGTAFDPLNYEPIGLKATDEIDGDITDKITVEFNNVDTSKPGAYRVTYKVLNSYEESDEKTIEVVVYTKPTIAAHNVAIKKDLAFDPLNYEPIELKATDPIDGDITDKITIESNNVDTSKPGKYHVTYKVLNSYEKSDEKTIEVTVYTKPTIEAYDVDIEIGTAFDPLNYEPIGLKATDPIDGDITDKVTVESNNVDTSKPGEYHVTYKVLNSYEESDEKTIIVMVPVIDDGWENGDPKGWKFFSGESIILEEDEENALNGKWVFFSDKHVAIYKQVELENNISYQITVYVKPEDEGTVAHHIVKVSLKPDSASGESQEILNTRLLGAEQIQKGYRKLTSNPFIPTKIEPYKKPIIVIENFLAGWIGGIKIIVEPTK
ncbi:immunoglobulin-like domain-containing protein [Peribacillus sp. YIM B13482]|uniref:lectin-like domain-containing protein n=1 Tax=Peribacillus sp. YIM B13482 TaxID=3366298 RepID=UPI003671292D